MDELCPLCLKMGANRKIKAVQINLEEAMWMCENEECPWPFFGSDKPTSIPRKVGEKWAYEWQIYRRVKERVGSIPVSIELSLYTPPVTPSGDVSAKDSMQSEIAKNTLETCDNTDIFSSNLSVRDSYAPRSVVEANFSSYEKADAAKQLNAAKIVPVQYEKNFKIFNDVPHAIPSIFDIDDDVTDKISIKLLPNSKSTDLLAHGSAVHSVENSRAVNDQPDTVLVTIPKLQIEKNAEIKLETSDPAEPNDSTPKGIPHIRSIARTNIDLQRFDPVNIFKIEKPDLLEITKYPATPPKRKSLENIADRFFSPKQHTTTITVDGIPPITLSYDLMDLEENSEKNLTVTSTPIPHKKHAVALQNNNHDEILSAEIPKKKLRQSINRRAARNGKSFEKFSFNTLRKMCKGLNTTDATIAVKNEPPKLEEIINRNQSCTYGSDYHSPTKVIVASSTITTTSVSKTIDSNQHVETMNSINLDPNSSIVTESSTVDHLSLSCLIDDMLLDGSQNATQNLNDDWLQSFFNENT